MAENEVDTTKENDKEQEKLVANVKFDQNSNLSLEDIDEENPDDETTHGNNSQNSKSFVLHPLQDVLETRIKSEKPEKKTGASLRSKLKSISVPSLPNGFSDLSNNTCSSLSIDQHSESENEKALLSPDKKYNNGSGNTNNFLQNIIPSLQNNTYRSRAREFDYLCKTAFNFNIRASNDCFIADYSCTLSALSGRLFVSRFHLSFHPSLVAFFGKNVVSSL